MANGDTYTDEEQPVDLISNLMAAARAAQALQNRGVRIIPQPTQLPPLNLGALMRMGPVGAAQVIRNRRALDERNASNEQNAQALMETLLKQQGEQRRFRASQGEYQRRKQEAQTEKFEQYDRAGKEFADQWQDLISKNDQATKEKDEAAKEYEKIRHFAASQQLAGNVGAPTPQGKPAPKEGVHIVPFRVTPITEDPVTRKTWRGAKARTEVANVLNTEFERRTKTLNDALEQWRQRTVETQDLLKQTRAAGLAVNQDGSRLVDFRTGRTYPIPATQKTKRWRFDTATGRIVPSSH